MVLVHAAPFFRERAARTAPLTVEAIDDAADFAAMEGVWNALLARAGVTHPFVSHEWMRTWWDCFGAGRKLQIVVVKRHGEPVAIAPLVASTADVYGVPVRRLAFLFNVHTPRLDVIAARATRDVYGALWGYLRDRRTSWDVLQLEQLPEGSATLDRLGRLADESGFPTGLWRSDASPFIGLADTTAPAYFQGLGAKHRSNMRNRTKRLSRLGPIDLETVTGGAALETALEDGFAIEAAAWKGESRTAIRSDPAVQRFYAQMARVAARKGWLRLQFLTLAGRRIAFAYSLVYAERLFLLKAGYDPEFAPFSPFNLLCERAIAQAFDERLQEFDFLGADAEWKVKWAPARRSHYWLFAFARRPKARLLHWLKFRIAPALRDRGFHPARPS